MARIAKVADSHELEKIEMRAAYCDALIAEAKKNPKIMAVDCDLMSSMGTTPFAKALPAQALNCGIQEANALGVAAGLSATGMIPFYHTFGVFATRRVHDQAFLSCAYAGLNVKIMGGDAGVSAAFNGGTHMPFEDMGIMRNIPTITIIEPSDSSFYAQLVPQMATTHGVFYMRSPRKNNPKIYADGNVFKIGEAMILREGTDATVIACGVLVAEALKAAERLAKEGIQIRVVDMFTIKPVDAACVIESAEKTGAIVTAENHSIVNGLGSAVAEVLVRNRPVPMEMVGVNDEFGEVGPQDYLMKRFGLTDDDVYAKVKRAIARKGK